MLNFQLENACNTLKNKRKTKSCELATALSTLCVRFFVKKPLLVLESESESDGTHFFTPSSTRHNAEHRCCGLAHTHMHFSSLYIPYNSALSQLPGVGGLTDYWIQKHEIFQNYHGFRLRTICIYFIFLSRTLLCHLNLLTLNSVLVFSH